MSGLYWSGQKWMMRTKLAESDPNPYLSPTTTDNVIAFPTHFVTDLSSTTKSPKSVCSLI